MLKNLTISIVQEDNGEFRFKVFDNLPTDTEGAVPLKEGSCSGNMKDAIHLAQLLAIDADAEN